MDEVFHHSVMLAHVAVEGELVAGAVHIAGRIFDLVIGVSFSTGASLIK